MSRKHHMLSPEKFTPSEEENSSNPWLKLGEFACSVLVCDLKIRGEIEEKRI